LPGHILGGPVIKQALITAREHEKTQSEYDDYTGILHNAVGIRYLGTPHKGSDQAMWDGIAANSAETPRKDHDDTIVDALSRAPAPSKACNLLSPVSAIGSNTRL